MFQLIHNILKLLCHVHTTSNFPPKLLKSTFFIRLLPSLVPSVRRKKARWSEWLKQILSPIWNFYLAYTCTCVVVGDNTYQCLPHTLSPHIVKPQGLSCKKNISPTYITYLYMNSLRRWFPETWTMTRRDAHVEGNRIARIISL